MALSPLPAVPTLLAHASGVIDGAMFLLGSILAIAAELATCLSLQPATVRRTIVHALAFGATSAAAGWLPQVLSADVLARATLVVMGVAVAAGLRLRGPAGWTAILCGGAAAGVFGGMQTATWQEALGAAAVLVLVMLSLLVPAAHVTVPPALARGVGLARRMAGAWIAAIGVLMIALLLRAPGA